ncbi:MAG: ABC transporter substrate binding protein [Methyloligellaceae bacterium]
MNRLYILVTAAVLVALSSVNLLAAEILMVTWQGKTVAEDGFTKQIKKLRPDVKFTYIDAKRNKGALAKALRQADLSKTDLVYSFGTTGTKIVKQYLKGKKPHVFNIVSAPVLSKIANSIEKPGKNITGARFLVDMKTQLSVLTKLKDVKTLAVWFDPREKQNTVILNVIKKEAEALGIKVTGFRIIPDSQDFKALVSEAAQKSNKLDALYFIASSSFTDYYKPLHAELDPKLLVMGAVNVYVTNGSTIALGADMEERGRAAAILADRVLKGEKAGEIPINLVTAKTAKLYVNKDKMASAGLKDIEKMGFNVKYLEQAK